MGYLCSNTDLEIAPLVNDPKDPEYSNFEVADIFVRCDSTPWFRIGKVCTLDKETTSIDAALTLQKGLIFWTAVHMRRELVAAGGKSGAASLQLGYSQPATLNMGSEEDGPIDKEDEGEIQISTKVGSLKEIPTKSFGFRPDWNPPGFSYKRREKDAMKKKRSSLDEMKEVAGEA